MLNPKVLYFHDETFLRYTELEKGFVGNGSERVPAVISFLGFVDFKNHFLSMLTHLEALRHLANLFEGFGKITYFFFSV